MLQDPFQDTLYWFSKAHDGLKLSYSFFFTDSSDSFICWPKILALTWENGLLCTAITCYIMTAATHIANIHRGTFNPSITTFLVLNKGFLKKTTWMISWCKIRHWIEKGNTHRLPTQRQGWKQSQGRRVKSRLLPFGLITLEYSDTDKSAWLL